MSEMPAATVEHLKALHGNERLHWCPQDPDRESPIAACGRDINKCDRHFDRPCKFGAAWTRSTDLASYQRQAYSQWPPPCEDCVREIERRGAVA